jgi:single-strand DNA-binding protein
MAGLNRVTLIGNLGKDPEVRTFEGGVKKAVFSLATSESVRKAGEWTDHTEWHNIVLWRGLAETAEKYLRKGSKLFVDGKIRNRSYEDKEGVKKYITEIEVDNMIMLDGRNRTDDSPGFQPSAASATGSGSAEAHAGSSDSPQVEDDLPF